jgi:H/ACA ribonucleoprotein complex subunit 4
MVIRDSAVDALCHGADLAAGGILSLSPDLKPGDMVRVETLKGELVAAGHTLHSSGEIYRNSQGIMVDIKKVFMEPGTYPPMWK